MYDCLAGFKYFKNYSSITDLGSGGGFPGVLLGIVFDNIPVNLVEKSPKKSEYLSEVKDYLKLKNLQVNNILVNEYKNKSEVITCRAFKPADEIIEMTENHFLSGGKYILFKGKMESINEELGNIRKKYNIECEIFKIAEKIDEKERHVVLFNKKP